MNRVIAGDYKGQGVMIWRKAVVITLPMFRTVRIDQMTVAQCQFVDKKTISIRFKDGKYCILRVSRSIYRAIANSLPYWICSNDASTKYNTKAKRSTENRISAGLLTFFLIFFIGGLTIPRDESGQFLIPDWYYVLCIAAPIAVTLLHGNSALKSAIGSLWSSISNKIVHRNELLGRPDTESPMEQTPEAAHKPALDSPGPVPVKDRDPMEVILLIESRFEAQYQFAYTHLLSLEDCQRLYRQTVNEFSSIELPLMAQVRFEQLCATYKEKFNITNPFVAIDAMSGHDFECWCAELLRKSGYVDVEVTKGSADQGVDILATKDGIKYAIQCKCYSSDLGNKPIQEVNTGRLIYHCQIGAVMTNRHFTAGGKEAAEATGVLLWDRDRLEEMLRQCSGEAQ